MELPDCKVLISYIETAATTKTRQSELKKQYFFTCNCPGCAKSPYEELKEIALLEGYRCKDSKCDGFLLEDLEKKSFTCQQCGLARDQQEIKLAAGEVERTSKKASTTLSSGNYIEACTMYKIIEKLQVKLCHPDSIKLLQTRDTLLKIVMELQDWEGALMYCKMTIRVYQKVYPAIHPMLGLQYYTCGKLEWLLERTEDALKSFTQATNILRVTHGTTTPFMRDLLSKLGEARAEASYKRSDNNHRMLEN